MQNQKFDLIIAGAGYVGLAAAVAIKQAAPDLDIVLVDAAPENVWQRDTRASAIAAAARRMLDQMGIWQEIADESQPINDMIVTDSRTSDPVRPVFLTFGEGAEADTHDALAHMVPNVALNGALRAKAEALGVTIHQGKAVKGFEHKNGFSHLTLNDDSQMMARLVVACDGVKSTLRDLAGIKTVKLDYGQSGIVGTIAHERPHEGRAVEHFLPSGPFAILPLKGNRSSIVWTESTADADRLVNEDEFVFDLELEQRFGLQLGAITMETKPRAFPLGLTLARDFIKPGLALAGDAAHGIHPIAGQGLNLGFKDVAALAETIVDAARLGQDIGSVDVLERYERWRRFDTVQMGATTDILNRLFSNDSSALRGIRSLGLGLVDRMPNIKKFFQGQAAGLSPANPRLLNGEAI